MLLLMSLVGIFQLIASIESINVHFGLDFNAKNQDASVIIDAHLRLQLP